MQSLQKAQTAYFENPLYPGFVTHSYYHPKLVEIFKHVHSTSEFSTNAGDKLLFKPLDLYECTCCNTGGFNRLISPRRNNLENAIVQRLVDSQGDKDQPLHLLSMGSGGLMSDFLTLEKLVLSGFKKITIDCVDPEGIDVGRIDRIRKFFADFPELSIEMEAYKDIDEVPVQKIGYSALLAVDYDTLASFDPKRRFICTGDLMKAYRRLSTTGFLGLGFSSNDDSLSGPNMTPIVLYSHPSLLFSLTGDLAQMLPQKEELTVCLPSLNFGGVSHLWVFAIALVVEKSAKSYRRILLSHLETSGNNDDLLAFNKMMRALFPAASIEISLCDNQKKHDLLLTGALEDNFKSKKYLSLLNPESSITYILERKGISRQINGKEDQIIKIFG